MTEDLGKRNWQTSRFLIDINTKHYFDSTCCDGHKQTGSVNEVKILRAIETSPLNKMFYVGFRVTNFGMTRLW